MSVPSLLPFLAANERPRMQQYFADRVAGRPVPDRYTYRAAHRDGSQMWIDALVKLVNWKGEAAVMNTIVQVDLQRDASRIEVIERVFRDQHLYSAVLAQVLDRISVIGPDLRYRFTNQPTLDYYDIPLDRLVGMHMAEVLGPKRFANALPYIERCLAGEDVHYRYEIDHPRGGTGWVDVSMSPFRPDGDAVDGLVVTMRDITELHRAQETVRASEARLRSVIDHTPGPVFLKGRDGRFQVVNPAFERYFGVSARDAIGRTAL